MKCPNCGTEMKDGMLYCEACGEEIQIVPDFEPEIEYSISKTLSGIVEEVLEEVPQNEGQKNKDKKKRFKLVVIISVIAVIVVIGIVITVNAVKEYQYNSEKYQIEKATDAVADGRYEDAIAYYTRALELNPTNASYRNTLAEIYKVLGNEDAYVSELIEILKNGSITEDERTAFFRKLINFYKEKEDYAVLNTILNNIQNPDIRTAYQEYLALPPEFSYQEGTYEEVIPLKLTSSIKGTIYYTLDGSMPDENSEKYTTPIFLETGSYQICAMFINEYGIKSEVVKKTYVIDIIKPGAPAVDTYSGEYTHPIMITVVVPPDCTVYYTTDGSVPTNQSYVYTGPIPMPLGNSEFNFVTYNKEGVAGDCTTRFYEFELETDFTLNMAMEELLGLMINLNKIEDSSGTAIGVSGKYLYAFQYVREFDNMGDFYVISEVYEDSAGIQTYTGSIFAVSINTHECFKVIKDADGSYYIEAF